MKISLNPLRWFPKEELSSNCSSDKIQAFQSYYEQKIAKTMWDFQSYWLVWNILSEKFFVKQKPFEECILSVWEDKMEKSWKDTVQQMTNSDIYCILSETLGNEDFTERERKNWVDRLVYKLKGDIIKENLGNVELLDYEDIFIEAINNGDRDFIRFILNEWKLFTKKSMDVLINTDWWDSSWKYQRWEVVWEYLEKFQWVNYQEIANKLIEARWWRVVWKYLEKFLWVNHQEIVDKLIETGQWRVVWEYLEKFQWVNHQKIANKLIETGQWDVVIEYLRKFQLTDYQEIVIKLIEVWKSYDLYQLNCREELPWLKYQEIVDKLIEVWQWWIVIECKNIFKRVNRQKTLDILSRSEKPSSLMKYLKLFPWKHQRILNGLNLDDKGDLIAIESNIDDIECLLSQEMAEKMCEYEINRWSLNFMIEKRDKFEKFSPKIAQIFILHGFVDVVLENPEKFWLKKEIA